MAFAGRSRPPTLNLRNLDPEIDLDVVAGEARQGNYEYGNQQFVWIWRAQRSARLGKY